MWLREFSSVYRGIKSDDVWKLWVDVNDWTSWNEDLASCVMDGPFLEGNHFMLQPRGMRAFKIVLTEVQEGRSFTDCTTFFGAKMYDTHTVEDMPEGVRISNALVVKGPLGWLWAWLVAKDVAASAPAQTLALVRHVRAQASENGTKMNHQLPFGFDRPEESPGFLLWQTTMVWQRLIRKVLEKHDVSHPQFVIMATLLWLEGHFYETTQVTLIQWTKLDKMTVSKALQRLEEEGLVRRSTDAKDTRAKNVSLTEAGKGLVGVLVPLVEKVDADFFKTLPAGDQEKLTSIFKALNSHADN